MDRLLGQDGCTFSLLRTVTECTTTRSLLHEIVAGLTRPRHTPPAGLLDDLYNRHNGNLRGGLRALYDLFAQDAC